MTSAATKLNSLRALADHPDTPPAEASNARRRIEEILERLRKERSGDERTHVRMVGDMPTSMSEAMERMFRRVTRSGSARMRHEYRSTPQTEDEIFARDGWPRNWPGDRHPVEFEQGWGQNGDLSIGWKCPGCGEHVTKYLSNHFLDRLKMVGKGVEDYIKERVGGTMNQLCEECWRKWDEKL